MSSRSQETSLHPALSPQEQQSAGHAASRMFNELVSKAEEKQADTAALADPVSGISHPEIFKKGTLIDIPDAPDAPASGDAARRKHRSSRSAPIKQRLVAICVKDDAQAEHVVDWALQNELTPKRDKVAIINVRQAANGLIGDLVSTNNAKDEAEREKSHGLLRRHAAPIKNEGYTIKGVSIRGVDVRGELVRKLVELKCDLLIIGNHASKTMRERIIGCKVSYLVDNSPCPVLVVPRTIRSAAEASAVAASAAAAIPAADVPPEPAPPSLPC
ncbi:hypothetical protein GGI07_003882 [Coemansia sp. Benny D115]|nr:hypothetical protein GGI07_003882 [Coemansia sp. Benny D115]